MRRPLTSHDPFAPPGSSPSRTTFASVMLSEAEPPRRFGAASLTVLDDQQRRQAVAVRDAEAARRQLEARDRFRVERARQAEEAIRIVDFHAVHDREVLIRRAAAHRQPAAELVGGRYAGQRLQRAEDVVERTRRPQHLRRRDRRPTATLRAAGRRPHRRSTRSRCAGRAAARSRSHPSASRRWASSADRTPSSVEFHAHDASRNSKHEPAFPVGDDASCARLYRTSANGACVSASRTTPLITRSAIACAKPGQQAVREE